MIYISYCNKQDEKLWKIYLDYIYTVTEKICKYYKDSRSIFIILTDSKNMKKFNQTYRNKASDTNVLAMEMKGDEFCLGEIFLSFSQIEQEFSSQTKLKSFEDYLLFIFTHGFLHLLGYDHQNDEEENTMNKEQNLLLKKISPVITRKLSS